MSRAGALPVLGPDDDELELGFPVEAARGARPPWPHTPTVEWQVCGACNYDCSYCIQSKRSRVGYPEAEELDAMLAFLASLDGEWEVKVTGGEPFASRLFLRRVVPGLMATRHRMSVLTNLSASSRHLLELAELTYGRLTILSASLHLEFTEPKAFLERLSEVRRAAAPDARFVVNCVLAPQHLLAVREAKRSVEDAGFRFFPQLMKVKRGVHAYTPDELRLVDEIVGGMAVAEQQRSANLAPAYLDRLCWTGARYFVLLQNGDVWSCRSARREEDGYLGNAVRGDARLLPGPHRCPYSICPCAVPANRGMIEGVPARIATDEEPA